MWEILQALLILLLSILWWMANRKPCQPVTDEEERVKFLLTLLVESRWSGLSYKLLYRHRHHRALTNADDLSEDSHAGAVSPSIPPDNSQWDGGWTPRMAVIPTCPVCYLPMLMRRNRTNHGLFWGCAEFPECRGTRRLGDTGVVR